MFGFIRNHENDKNDIQRGAFGEQMVIEPFPVLHLQFPYNINTEIVKTSTTGSGTVTHVARLLNLNTTAVINSSGTFISVKSIRYQPGQGVVVTFTSLFTQGVAGSSQKVGIGDVDLENGFFFGFNGVDFGIFHVNASSTTFIKQSKWNGARFDKRGSIEDTILDPTKGNVYRIQYQWLGFGAIYFSIEIPSTGHFELCHIIQYANANIAPSLENPTLVLSGSVINTTNNTAITTKIGSMGAMLEGVVDENNSLTHSSSSAQTVTTEEVVLNIKNKASYQSVTNRIIVKVIAMTITTDGNKPAAVRLVLNGTVANIVYGDVSTNTSVVEEDDGAANLTISGGVDLGTYVVSANSGENIDLTFLDLILQPTDNLSAVASSAISALIGVTFIYKEFF